MQTPIDKPDQPSAWDPTSRRKATGYMPIEDYGLIGNMKTCALVATDGGLDFMCWYVSGLFAS
ncbi:hypothetical protein BDV95DRAFT_556193 [Massariosphaeria phaeospora]|uniref:Uncharacterized protein n=1 Tax=Massariosphaeria phaeospora TaxID=100035 RepID=A0A7C8IHM6_9PLEO|nr:hypothetical protein BDV95DRAFT_556193 [Massariosphaeria phaeospora]